MCCTIHSLTATSTILLLLIFSSTLECRTSVQPFSLCFWLMCLLVTSIHFTTHLLGLSIPCQSPALCELCTQLANGVVSVLGALVVPRGRLRVTSEHSDVSSGAGTSHKHGEYPIGCFQWGPGTEDASDTAWNGSMEILLHVEKGWIQDLFFTCSYSYVGFCEEGVPAERWLSLRFTLEGLLLSSSPPFSSSTITGSLPKYSVYGMTVHSICLAHHNTYTRELHTCICSFMYTCTLCIVNAC